MGWNEIHCAWNEEQREREEHDTGLVEEIEMKQFVPFKEHAQMERVKGKGEVEGKGNGKKASGEKWNRSMCKWAGEEVLKGGQGSGQTECRCIMYSYKENSKNNNKKPKQGLEATRAVNQRLSWLIFSQFYLL